MSKAPVVSRILETALYVEDLDRSTRFYTEVIGLAVMLATPRLVALDAGGGGALLLFKQGATSQDLEDASGVIPGHEGTGRLHMAFAIAETDYERWLARFAEHGIPIAGETRWTRGGRSLYVRDPDGHAVELATPGLWPNY